MDPVDPKPTDPLHESYTYHAPFAAAVEENFVGPQPKSRWVMGVDEAGRGPVLGPMVYGVAYCPLSYVPTLETLGFDDSKALTHDFRNHLFSLFKSEEQLMYSTRVISSACISRDMLRKQPVNLNRQAEEATFSLIRETLARGVDIAECYVDALGPSPQYQAKLSGLFPTISFTVCPKADSLFKIVGAASIAAKITRDRWITSWIHPEENLPEITPLPPTAAATTKRKAAAKKAKKAKKAKLEVKDDDVDSNSDDEEDEEEPVEEENNGFGSGYPSDPRTQHYLKQAINPIFGFPSMVRFSWATVKVMMEKDGKGVSWVDDMNPPPVSRFFSGNGAIENNRPKPWKDLGLRSVGQL